MKLDWKAPHARQILRADAPRDEWLSMRTTGLGGSDLPVITGDSHYEGQSPYNLWLEKTSDDLPVEQDNDLFWFGTAVEPILADRFTADTGITTRRTGMWQEKAIPWALANPDRFTSDGGILEIKTTSRHTSNGKSYLAGVVPPAHLIQLTWYMQVTGRHLGHLIVLVDREVIILPVDFDAQLGQQLIELGHDFWHYVETHTPPPLDLATVTLSEVTARYPEVIDPESTVEAILPDAVMDDVAALAELKAEVKDASDEIKSIETRLKGQIGDKEYLTVNGQPVARWQTVKGRKSFDKQTVLTKICADRGLEPTKQALADIEQEYTTQGAPTRRLSLIEGTTP